ncbi:fatty-acid amide hydrolase 1-like isoform X4 [Dreissena polymorpha]|uniref:fatty-acid amide hydrolase 1-like isoform X3 n=1 Tax=Dreissena polymorpha TaxID=45954 RepID=UPI0022644820|nr:fatty-acid amide hydrolase 1-like isoform X3 [Dreissena polymorpha]XP_052246736.1 fatty-acid amide hydrolase 1-like isoform X4 [Dreissena polymorpha]
MYEKNKGAKGIWLRVKMNFLCARETLSAYCSENAGHYASLVVGTIGALCIAKYLWKWRGIKEKIRYKQGKCRKAIQNLQESLDKNGPSENDVELITSLSFEELHSKLQKGELKAVDVLKAFQTKALKKNEDLNFMVEPITEAMAIAVDLDKVPPNKRGPLHGIPISVKENYYIKGYDSTGGLSNFLFKPRSEDGHMITVLKELGAIPFVRTNIPQSMMTFECSNPIYGTTFNPHNLTRGPGGSSGGEGAILGSEASLLGWGSDIGGSLRIPSHFCGVCCLKPTAGRLGFQSTEELVRGQTLVVATIGPMARDVYTLGKVMEAVWSSMLFQMDTSIPPLPFNHELYDSSDSLCIGYYDSDGYVPPIPGVKRGLNLAVEALRRKGHTLVPFEVPDPRGMFCKLFAGAVFGDGGKNFISQLSEDVVDSSIQMLIYAYKFPNFLLRPLSYIVSLVHKDEVPGQQMRSMLGGESISGWWELAHEIQKYKLEFERLWKEKGLDAIVCPVMPFVASPIGAVKFLLGGATYTTLYNVLNYPAGCVPVTRVTAIDEKEMENYPSTTLTEKFVRKYYSSETTGLPVSVQCVALPFRDEMALRVMRDLETELKKPRRK